MKKLLLLSILLLTGCNVLTDNQLASITKEAEKKGYSNIEYQGDGLARNLCNAEYDKHLLFLAEKNNKLANLVICYGYVGNKIQIHKVENINKYRVNTFEGIHD